MGNKPKQASGNERRAKIAEMRRQQQLAERRKNMLIIGLGALVGLGLIAAVALPLVLKEAEADKPVPSYGVPLAAAACDPPSDDPLTTFNHVGPGTQNANVTRVDYAVTPPSTGDHFQIPAPFSKKFYTAEDSPELEELVHNLEHGYTIVWYDSTVTGDQLDALKGLSRRVPKDAANRKFIVSAWDETRGAFPEGKHVAFAHWSAAANGAGHGNGHRVFCGQVSGEAIATFMAAYPAADSPEPRAP